MRTSIVTMVFHINTLYCYCIGNYKRIRPTRQLKGKSLYLAYAVTMDGIN